MTAGEPSLDNRTMVELDRDGCLRLLANAPTGRIVSWTATSRSRCPCPTLHEGSVVFKTVPGGLLDEIGRRNDTVAFEADGLDLERYVAWSVLVQGRAEVSSVTGASRDDGPRRPERPGSGTCQPMEVVPTGGMSPTVRLGVPAGSAVGRTVERRRRQVRTSSLRCGRSTWTPPAFLY